MSTYGVSVLGAELATLVDTAVAADRASNLRAVQTGGIALALLNFAFILFKFLRRLRTSDAAIDAANEENREILTSVREGLFLITPDHRVGSQLSSSAHELFGRRLQPGDNFFAILEPLVSAKALAATRQGGAELCLARLWKALGIVWLTVAVLAPSWWLLRASNTQDVLVARAESGDVAGLERLLAEVDAQLAASGLERGPQAGH